MIQNHGVFTVNQETVFHQKTETILFLRPSPTHTILNSPTQSENGGINAS